ncbi:MAG: two-component system, OmpR family, sensor histidine kinase SenX3 [Actinomycetota bacterium]
MTPWAAAAGAGLLLVVTWVLALLRRRALARRLASVATRLDGGEAVGAGSLEDVLHRLERAAETAGERSYDLQAVSERLAQAIDTLPNGVVVCDEDGEIRYRNHRAEEFTGTRHGEALAQQATSEALTAALGGEAGSRAVDLFGPPRRNLRITAAPLLGEHRTIGAVAVIEDVSEGRRLEAVRRDFVANVSHELKTPVGALALLAETLADEEDQAVTRRLSRRMQIEAARVGRIIEDLLDLSRLEAEESPLREPVALHLVLAQAVEQVRPSADARNVTLEVGDAPRRLRIVGDRRQLVSAVFNLLENAVKYSDKGASIQLTCATDGREVAVSVRDHGMGIPTRDLERIFERFYRVDRSRGRDTGGTGLGLAIVRHVATNHGGRVEVESAEGQGSTFTIRLPAPFDLVALSPTA